MDRIHHLRLPNRRGWTPSTPPFINLCGDYRFLRGGYWALIDAEMKNVPSRPTPLQAVTAQNTAAALLEAARTGIRCAKWVVARKSEDGFVPGVFAPVAGYAGAFYTTKSPRSRDSQFLSASQNGTRTVLSVRLDGELKSMKSVMGLTTSPHYDLAWQVWQTFGIPLTRIWYLDTEQRPLFVSLDPQPLHDLTERELRMLEEVSQRPMSPS